MQISDTDTFENRRKYNLNPNPNLNYDDLLKSIENGPYSKPHPEP